MKHENPSRWLVEDAAKATGALGPAAEQTPATIAAAAARAVGCRHALVVTRSPERWELVALSGFGGPLTVTAAPACAKLKLLNPIRGSVPVLELNGRPVEAVGCAFEFGGSDLGMLLVADPERSDLNTAQTYVLRAHAAHLSTLMRLTAPGDQPPAHLEREQIERLRLLESVAVHARDSIIITEAEPIDRPGPRILYCNAAFTKATGYEPDDVIGQTPRILQGAKTSPESRAKLRAALEAWEPIEIELINYRKDGTEFWVELSIVPVADESGWYTHWVSVQRDITERRQAEELSVRVRVAEVENEVLATEIQERRRVEAELLYTAFHDSLTRLRNRAFLMDRLSDALHSSREEAGCAMLFLDLDQFKVVNDSLGHLAGDVMLKEVGARLKRCVRPQDTLARLGGDEFAILMEDLDDPALAVACAERILDALRAPVRLGRTDVFPSCSLGIVLSSERTKTPEDLIRDADIAMYEAKRAGPGGYSIFEAFMCDGAVDALAMRTELRRAIELDQFELLYQPILEPGSGRLAGFEALLRWNDGDRGVITPDVFVPIAEELGLIRTIGRWVLREACARLADWQRLSSRPDLRMSVNVSATEFMNADFLPELRALIAQIHLAPSTLELEITESILLNPAPSIEGLMAEIRALGVRVSLDDFGTGYSSLRYINQYPIDAIKIDKSFVRSMCSDRRTRAIVEAVVKLGATLDIDVVAEGIETAVQEQLVRELGCPLGQGYWYARPLSESDAVAFCVATSDGASNFEPRVGHIKRVLSPAA